MKSSILLLTTFIGISLLEGCAVRPPTIAHTHLGHMMTGWPDTPGQKGLFSTAEDFAKKALANAESADKEKNNIVSKKNFVAQVIQDTKPSAQGSDGKYQYGVKNATEMAMHHLQFAATSPDASENLVDSAKQFEKDYEAVIKRCDIIALLGEAILASQSESEINALSDQLLKQVRANLDGDDSDGDGKVGSSVSEYGLKQLSQEFSEMIKREDPPYKAVDTWYLFNLVREPNGTWVFRKLNAGSTGSGAAPY